MGLVNQHSSLCAQLLRVGRTQEPTARWSRVSDTVPITGPHSWVRSRYARLSTCVGTWGREGTSHTVISRELVMVTVTTWVSMAQTFWAPRCQLPKPPPTSCTSVQSISWIQAGATAVRFSCHVPGAVEVVKWCSLWSKTLLPRTHWLEGWQLGCAQPVSLECTSGALQKRRVLDYYPLAGLRRVDRAGLTKFSSLTWPPVLKRGRKSYPEQLKHADCRQKSYRRQRNVNPQRWGNLPFWKASKQSVLNSIPVHSRRNPGWGRRKISTTTCPFELT